MPESAQSFWEKWNPRKWTCREWADTFEVVTGIIAIALGAATAIVPAEKKTYFAIPGAVFGILALAAKSFAKHYERIEKESEKQAEQERIALHQAELAGKAKAMILLLCQNTRERICTDRPTEEIHKFRITVFVPRTEIVDNVATEKLVIFARVGAYPNSTTSWTIDPRCQGVSLGIAARTWEDNDVRETEADCDWPEDDNQYQKLRYATSLELTIEQAERLNVKSRWFRSLPIMANGRRWGVLVLDSSLKPGFSVKARTPNKKKEVFENCALLIGSVIQEIGQ